MNQQQLWAQFWGMLKCWPGSAAHQTGDWHISTSKTELTKIIYVHAKHVVFFSSHLRNHVSDLKFFSKESLSLIWAQLFSDPEHIIAFRLWFYCVSLFSQRLNEVNRWIKLSSCLIEPLNGKFYVTLKQNKGKWPKVKMDLIHDQS